MVNVAPSSSPTPISRCRAFCGSIGGALPTVAMLRAALVPRARVVRSWGAVGRASTRRPAEEGAVGEMPSLYPRSVVVCGVANGPAQVSRVPSPNPRRVSVDDGYTDMRIMHMLCTGRRGSRVVALVSWENDSAASLFESEPKWLSTRLDTERPSCIARMFGDTPLLAGLTGEQGYIDVFGSDTLGFVTCLVNKLSERQDWVGLLIREHVEQSRPLSEAGGRLYFGIFAPEQSAWFLSVSENEGSRAGRKQHQQQDNSEPGMHSVGG
ncbi:hypothetical protein NUW58_g9560 [Xylaria curta]|uniref:Uncharacterized protein n=1 Tax=Xylaria curta TaxID=42375 RepID=A0ACC1MWK1_9PEZI|nr:hypothetical protein NUW58_g9560 [Xylaria curta]